MSTTPRPSALRGMLSYFADSGACAIVRPPCSRTALRPSEPSDPVPERTIPIALSPWSSASERKNTSMGVRRGSIGVFTQSTPMAIVSEAFGGMT